MKQTQYAMERLGERMSQEHVEFQIFIRNIFFFGVERGAKEILHFGRIGKTGELGAGRSIPVRGVGQKSCGITI